MLHILGLVIIIIGVIVAVTSIEMDYTGKYGVWLFMIHLLSGYIITAIGGIYLMSGLFPWNFVWGI